ncbi:MAG: CsbD family protein [Leptolyngbyaceae cyanobacterium]
MDLKLHIDKFKRLFCLCVAVFILFSGAMFGSSSNAVAAEKAVKIAQDRTEQALDRVAGAGTANQIEGQVKEGVGKAQRQVDKALGQADGAATQAAGRVQKDIGQTQEAAENAADAAEDSAEGIIDSVKDFFGQ